VLLMILDEIINTFMTYTQLIIRVSHGIYGLFSNL